MTSTTKALAAALLALVLLATTTLLCSVEGKQKARRIDYEALEKAWEAGDAREELQSAGDEQLRALASRSEADAKALGPQMVFVTLHGGHAEPLAAIASRWKEALWIGGLEVTVYELEAGTKLLVGLQRGVQAPELRRFLLEQPEVREIEWDGQTYAPGDVGKRQQQQPAEPKRTSTSKAADTNRVDNAAHEGGSAETKKKIKKTKKKSKRTRRTELTASDEL